jgi:hypothetical protein
VGKSPSRQLQLLDRPTQTPRPLHPRPAPPPPQALEAGASAVNSALATLQRAANPTITNTTTSPTGDADNAAAADANNTSAANPADAAHATGTTKPISPARSRGSKKSKKAPTGGRKPNGVAKAAGKATTVSTKLVARASTDGSGNGTTANNASAGTDAPTPQVSVIPSKAASDDAAGDAAAGDASGGGNNGGDAAALLSHAPPAIKVGRVWGGWAAGKLLPGPAWAAMMQTPGQAPPPAAFR